jgi:hypothetical protein
MYYLFACFVCSILLAYGKILILLTLSKYNDVLLYLRIMMQDLYNKVGLDSCGSDNSQKYFFYGVKEEKCQHHSA